MRDWLKMTPADFDVDAEEALFSLDVDPADVPADDGCGTGDLLAEIQSD